MKISTGVKVDECSRMADSFSFYYDNLEWEANFQGYEGYGSSPQEAVDDIISNLEGHQIVQYLNGYILEEI